MIPTPEQEMVRDMARRFVAERLAPFSTEWDRSGAFPRDRIAEMGALGLMGMLVPEAYDGAASDHANYVLALEEIAVGNGALSTVMSVHNSVGCAPILRFGTEEQKQRFLKPMARGEWLGAFALTEPQAGSDASALRRICAAARQADGPGRQPLRLARLRADRDGAGRAGRDRAQPRRSAGGAHRDRPNATGRCCSR